jgi:hypothetical protein
MVLISMQVPVSQATSPIPTVLSTINVQELLQGLTGLQAVCPAMPKTHLLAGTNNHSTRLYMRPHCRLCRPDIVSGAAPSFPASRYSKRPRAVNCCSVYLREAFTR